LDRPENQELGRNLAAEVVRTGRTDIMGESVIDLPES
jgi:hypothetical protein